MDREPTELPHPLEYDRPPVIRRTGPASGQVLLGFFAWLLTLVLTGLVGAAAAAVPVVGHVLRVILVPLPVVAAVFLGVWLRVRHGWRGFLPGLLLGFTLTCLLPVGILAVIGKAFR